MKESVPNELKTENGEGQARNELDDDAVRPKIDVLQEAMVGLGQLARAQKVQGPFLAVRLPATPHLLLNGERQVERNADERRADVGEQNGEQSPVQSAPVPRSERMGHGNVAPDGQQKRQPDGDGMKDLRGGQRKRKNIDLMKNQSATATGALNSIRGTDSSDGPE